MSDAHAFVGGMRSGNGNASWPLVSLTVDPHGCVTVQLRGRLLEAVFGRWLPKVVYRAADPTHAENVRGGFFRSGGVRLFGEGLATVVFWSSQPREIMTALAEQGVQTTWHERPPKVWTRP